MGGLFSFFGKFDPLGVTILWQGLLFNWMLFHKYCRENLRDAWNDIAFSALNSIYLLDDSPLTYFLKAILMDVFVKHILGTLSQSYLP